MKHPGFAVLVVLAGCMAEADDNAADATQGAQVPQSRAACLAAGGRWARGGLNPDPLCFLPNPDAGTSCTKATDCVGTCLSDSRTCAPEQPIFGCYGFLDDDGAEVMICAD